MQNTELLYMSDMATVEGTATMLEMMTIEAKTGEKTVLFLDRTLFYPQGGGQPYDQGVISSESARFIVEEVRYLEGMVKHAGYFESGRFSVGEKVQLHVDPQRRILHARLHSAGHLIDMALQRLGKDWKPVKGYHFPEGPYVEYEATLPDDPDLQAKLEKTCNELIQENAQTHLEFVSLEEFQKRGFTVPPSLDSQKPLRLVYYGDFGIPCGGTHVAQLSELRCVTIRKLKTEGAHVRVAYDVER